MEDKTKGRGWIFEKKLEKQCVFLVCLEVTRFDLGSSWGPFWGHLGGLGAILEASWASWGRLDGVLGRLGVLGNAEERPTIYGCPRAGPGPETTWSC